MLVLCAVVTVQFCTDVEPCPRGSSPLRRQTMSFRKSSTLALTILLVVSCGDHGWEAQHHNAEAALAGQSTCYKWVALKEYERGCAPPANNSSGSCTTTATDGVMENQHSGPYGFASYRTPDGAVDTEIRVLSISGSPFIDCYNSIGDHVYTNHYSSPSPPPYYVAGATPFYARFGAAVECSIVADPASMSVRFKIYQEGALCLGLKK